MLKATQHNVGYIWQGNRLGAATNSISGGSEGHCARKWGWGVYGWKESPQVIVGKVTMFTWLVTCVRAALLDSSINGV